MPGYVLTCTNMASAASSSVTSHVLGCPKGNLLRHTAQNPDNVTRRPCRAHRRSSRSSWGCRCLWSPTSRTTAARWCSAGSRLRRMRIPRTSRWGFGLGLRLGGSRLWCPRDGVWPTAAAARGASRVQAGRVWGFGGCKPCRDDPVLLPGGSPLLRTEQMSCSGGSVADSTVTWSVPVHGHAVDMPACGGLSRHLA